MPMTETIHTYEPGLAEPGRLYRFPSGNVYRYDPDGDAERPWCIQEVVNPDRTPAKKQGERVR